jgi:hypothetical protein
VFGIALILLGVFGIVGGKKKNGFCLFIFNIGLLAGLIVFAAIGITASVYLGDMEESSKSIYNFKFIYFLKRLMYDLELVSTI